MKNIILILSLFIALSSCNQVNDNPSSNLNEEYSKNIATAKKIL
jgi:hypothetical protein